LSSTPPFTWALMKKATIETRIQASTASTTHLTTRRGVIPPGFASRGGLASPLRLRLMASSGFAPNRSRRRLRDR
jgi:hypothetical protein